MTLAGFLRSLLAGLAGFVGYGLWAWYANREHGADVAMRSGLVQGGYSLVLTFVMTLVTEALYQRWQHQSKAALSTTTVVSSILLVSAYSIHHLVGTPEILMTIAPGFVIGSIYTYVYVLGLRRARSSSSTTEEAATS